MPLPIPAPGTPGGPCSDPCSHPRCKELRRDAASLCVYCEKPIGYDAPNYLESAVSGPVPRYSHGACAEAPSDPANDPRIDSEPEVSIAHRGVWRGVFPNGAVVPATFDGYNATCIAPATATHRRSMHVGRNAVGSWAVRECFQQAGFPPYSELVPPGGMTKAEAVEAELDACIAVAGAALHRADLPGIIAGLRARKAPKTPELPGVAVEREPDAGFREAENCAGCRAPTVYWTKLADRTPGQQVALCEDCAKTMKPSEVPSKRAWCEKERALSPVRGR